MEKPYSLRLYPDRILRKKADPVKAVDGTVRDLFKGMSEIMYSYQGIGLAAPQVGVLQRVIIADIGDGLISLANPIVVDQNGVDVLVEGCLSIPDTRVNIMRSQTIFVRGISSNGKAVERELSGLVARVVLHEIDHLNGVLIIDYDSDRTKDYGTAYRSL